MFLAFILVACSFTVEPITDTDPDPVTGVTVVVPAQQVDTDVKVGPEKAKEEDTDAKQDTDVTSVK